MGLKPGVKVGIQVRSCAVELGLGSVVLVQAERFSWAYSLGRGGGQ